MKGDNDYWTSDDNVQPLLRPAIPEFPLEVLPKAARDYAKASSLPTALLAGSALGVLAGAIGGEAELRGDADEANRAIVWVALLAETGAGKSPSLAKLARPLRDLRDKSYETYREKRRAYKALDAKAKRLEEPPTWGACMRGYATIEALYRTLDAQPDVLLQVDELKAFLGALGRYRATVGPSGADTGGDAPYFMEFWSGVAPPLARVGGSKDEHNAVDINIPRPTVSIIGPMTLADQRLLGAEADGFRARWLPHPSEPRHDGISNPDADIVKAWVDLVTRLYERRSTRRIWMPDADARRRMRLYVAECEQRAVSLDASMTLTAALAKAGVYLERVCLILAEADWDGALPDDGAIPPVLRFDQRIVGRAARWLDFCYDAWAAIGDRDTVAFTAHDRVADPVCDQLEHWIEQHGTLDDVGRLVLRSELYRRKVAGVRTRDDWRRVLSRYVDRNPGCVVGLEGSKAVKVYAPPRLKQAARRGSDWSEPSHPNHFSDQSEPNSDPDLVRMTPESGSDYYPSEQSEPLESGQARRAKRTRGSPFPSQNGQVSASNDPGVKV